MNVTNNGKFALLLLLKETSSALLPSSSMCMVMWVHSINKNRETHGEYVIYHIYWKIASYLLEYGIIFIGICYHIYWNILTYLLEYVSYRIYWNMLSYLLEYAIIFIGICYHIYRNMLSYVFINCYLATVIKIIFKNLQA